VVTHHLPHHLSVSPKFAGDALNPAFVSNLPAVLLTQAGLWIHGHTHSSALYCVRRGKANAMVVCNPRGYPSFGGTSENEEFDPKMLLEYGA